jgi:hypothetical protein
MVAGRRSGLYAPFSAPRAPKNKLGQVQTPGKAKNMLRQNCLARINQVNACEIHFGARLMELPLVSLSSQCHRVLIHFR